MKRRTRVYHLLAVAAWLVLGPGSESARGGKGQQSGSIEGVVYDTDEIPAPGVIMTLTGKSLTGPQNALTDRRGRFRFVDLPPGTYDVTAQSERGSAYAIGVALSIAEKRALSMRLAATGNEVIVVEDTTIDSSRATVSHRVNRDIFSQLPFRRTSVAGLFQALPGTAEEANGYLLVRGGSWVDNQLIIDGINYSDPITNSIFTRFDFYAVEEIEVLSGGLEADYGEALGGVVNIVTRSGGDEHQVGGRVASSPAPLSGKVDDSEAGARYDVNLNVGGPLIKDRAKYFANISYQRALDPVPQYEGLDLARGRTTNRVLGFGKLTWEPKKHHKLTFHLAGFHEHYGDFNIDRVVLKEAQETNRTGGAIAQLNYSRLYSCGIFEVSSGGYYFGSENNPASGDVDTPAVVDQMTGVISGNALELFHNRNLRWQTQVSGTRYADFLGSHEIKAGAELALMSILYEQTHTGNEIVYSNGSPCMPAEGVFTGCAYAERTGTQAADGSLIPGIFSARATGLKTGLYVRDSWTVGGGVRINPGWRIDIGRITAQDGATMARFNGLFGPRLGLTWDIGKRGISVLRMSGSRYYQTGMLALPLFFGPSIRREHYGFNPITRQFDLYNPQRSTGGDSGGEVDLSRSTVAPHTDEAVLGFEQVLSGHLLAGVTGIYRRSSYLYDSLESNLIWNEVGDAIVGFRDNTPQARFTLYTGPDVFREYAALEFTLKGRFAKKGFVLGSYTLSRLYGTSDLDEVTGADNVVPYVAANPRQRQYLYGPLRGDRRHVGKIALLYGLPWAPVTVGTRFSAASGTPYSRLYYNAYLGGYHDRRAPRGIDPGDLNDPDDDRELRTEPLIGWSLFGSWDLSRWVAIDKMALEFQVLNVLNSQTAIQVEERNLIGAEEGGGFGSPLIRQGPLRVEIGLSFRY